MPRITKVYTRSGDEGKTGLGGGQRVDKDSLRIEAYGTVDELNCIVGMAVLDCSSSELKACLPKIQNELFHLGSDLCILEEDKKKWLPKKRRRKRRHLPNGRIRAASPARERLGLLSVVFRE